MNLLSINIARKQPLRISGRDASTGIFKQPLDGPVRVTKLGLEGDAIVSKKHHGGPDQAVYVYTSPDYAWWAEQLGRELAPGTFGENLTISDLASAEIQIGDRLTVGEVVLEVTSCRIPCMTLESRMGIRGFAKQFRDAERPGFYCRVIQEGALQAGDQVLLNRIDGESISLIEVFRDFYEPVLEESAIRRFLAAPIAIRARVHKEKQLEKVLSEGPRVGTSGPFPT
jgi:MOSC domain-containing protein YiiM